MQSSFRSQSFIQQEIVEGLGIVPALYIELYILVTNLMMTLERAGPRFNASMNWTLQVIWSLWFMSADLPTAFGRAFMRAGRRLLKEVCAERAFTGISLHGAHWRLAWGDARYFRPLVLKQKGWRQPWSDVHFLAAIAAVALLSLPSHVMIGWLAVGNTLAYAFIPVVLMVTVLVVFMLYCLWMQEREFHESINVVMQSAFVKARDDARLGLLKFVWTTTRSWNGGQFEQLNRLYRQNDKSPLTLELCCVGHKYQHALLGLVQALEHNLRLQPISSDFILGTSLEHWDMVVGYWWDQFCLHRAELDRLMLFQAVKPVKQPWFAAFARYWCELKKRCEMEEYEWRLRHARWLRRQPKSTSRLAIRWSLTARTTA